MDERDHKTNEQPDGEDHSDLLAELLEDAVSISDRFSPEPVFGPTGKGYMKSEGVEEIKKWKESVESK